MKHIKTQIFTESDIFTRRDFKTYLDAIDFIAEKYKFDDFSVDTGLYTIYKSKHKNCWIFSKDVNHTSLLKNNDNSYSVYTCDIGYLYERVALTNFISKYMIDIDHYNLCSNYNFKRLPMYFDGRFLCKAYNRKEHKGLHGNIYFLGKKIQEEEFFTDDLYEIDELFIEIKKLHPYYHITPRGRELNRDYRSFKSRVDNDVAKKGRLSKTMGGYKVEKVKIDNLIFYKVKFI